MREIKFRAWDKGTNWMCFIDAIYQPVGGVHQKYDLHVISNDKKIGGANRDEIELMQYTGLKDKNGVEIYEGDILSEVGHYVNSDKKMYMEVNWQKNHSAWMRGKYTRMTPKNIQHYNSEVIGNIYENPELLNNK